MAVKKIQMEFLEDNMSKELERAMVNFNGIMDKSFKGNGKVVRKTVLVFGNLQKEITMKANGDLIDSMVKVYSNIN